MNEIERAIKHFVSLQKRYTTQHNGEQCALVEIDVSALREKAERSKGCEYCDDNFMFWQTKISGGLPNVRFCPVCGRPLKTE